MYICYGVRSKIFESIYEIVCSSSIFQLVCNLSDLVRAEYGTLLWKIIVVPGNLKPSLCYSTLLCIFVYPLIAACKKLERLPKEPGSLILWY